MDIYPRPHKLAVHDNGRGPAIPDVRLTRDVAESGTLLAIDRARQVLGFEPRHSWRDHVSPAATA